jgi:hypothetical protein
MEQKININNGYLYALLFKLKQLGYRWNQGNPIDPKTPPSDDIKSIIVHEKTISWSSINYGLEAIDELDFIIQNNDADGIVYKINVPDFKFAVLHKLGALGYIWATGKEIKPTDWKDKKIESIIAWEDKTITYSEYPIRNCDDVISDSKFIEEPVSEQKEYNFVEPDHYKKGDKEVWEIMIDMFGQEKFESFCLLNAFKYISRAGDKPGDDFKQDINKAIWYLNKIK